MANIQDHSQRAADSQLQEHLFLLCIAPYTLYSKFFKKKTGHILRTLGLSQNFYCWKNVGMILAEQIYCNTCFCTDLSSYISIT
jgi:hypothetical protein